jgi:hypothetical protein
MRVREYTEEALMAQSNTRTDIRNIAGAEVCVPTGAVQITERALAPRLRTLQGARIGILDNHKEFADIVLRGVASTLQREHGVSLTVWRKDYLGKPSPYAREMAGACDAVINGVGH